MRRTRRVPRWSVLCLAVVAAAGCNRFEPVAVFDLASVNVASLAPDWPGDVGKLTPAQQEVLATRGRPDHLRARWDRRGNLTWGAELRMRYDRQRITDIERWHHHRDLPPPFELSWIYQAEDQDRVRRAEGEVFRGEEIIFLSPTEWEAVPVSDQLGTIIDHGDPEEIREPQTWQGHLLEHWVYFREGLIYHYVDGRIDRVERITPTPVRVRPEI